VTALLSDSDFAGIIRLAPLVSIDFLIRDDEGRVLVGRRSNAPARGFWFVPGGRIRKNETFKGAFARILETETGCRAAFDAARFIGVFEQFYADDHFGMSDSGTHYVALVYELKADGHSAIVLDSQHDIHHWMSEAELAASADVHPYTKTYFSRK
jgi:colanic acid biosynthesis protein WcaH